MTAGQELAREGQNAALAAATLAHIRHLDDVRNSFELCIELSADNKTLWGDGFTAEDVRGYCLSDTQEWLLDHTNVLPALFGAASRTRRIRATGWTTPTRASRHGNAIRTWRATRHHAA